MEDDQVVARVPVFLRKHETGRIVVTQFPLRNSGEPYEKVFGSPLRCKVKCADGVDAMEIEYSLKTLQRDQDAMDEDLIDEQKLFLRSRTALQPDINGNFAIGMFQDDRFMLIPVNQVFQMIPKLKSAPSPSEESNIQVKFEIGEDRRLDVRAKRVKTSQEPDYVAHASVEAAFDEIPWRNVEMQPPFDEAMEFLLEKPDAMFQYNLDSEAYLEAVVGQSGHSESSIKTRMLSILKNADIVGFSDLCEYLEVESNFKELIALLETYSYCIDGAWVIKESPKFRGRLETCRNFLIGLFSKGNGIVSSDEFIEISRLSFTDSRRLLTSIAVPVDAKMANKWKLKYERDPVFVRQFKEIVDSQKRDLDILYRSSTEDLMRCLPLNVKERRQKGESVEAPSKNLEQAKAQLEIFLERQFEAHGVCTIQELRKELSLVSQDMLVHDNHLHLIDNSAFEYRMVQDATNIIGDLYCRRSLNNPAIDSNRKCFIKFLSKQNSKPFKRNDVRKFFQDDMDEPLDDKQWRKFIEEFCDKVESSLSYVLKKST